MAEQIGCGHSVAKNTEKLLQEKSLFDFTVRVEDVELPCHRVILAASSHFFRALLMTDMKEAKEGCVTISGISLETFRPIFKSMYTGKITLTLDNFIDIWRAADQLQIDFVVRHCEDFATKVTSVENFESMKNVAEFLNSDKVCSFLDTFLLANFDSVCEINHRPIMEMDFRDFDFFIRSHHLNVRNEDLLTKLVLKWVEYVPEKNSSEDEDEKYTDTQQVTVRETSSNNESGTSLITEMKDQLYTIQGKRLRRLASLLKSVRTCFVSAPMLKYLLKHQLIINNTEARDILIDAVLYKTTHYNHGQLPANATHRTSSEWEHCSVVHVTDLAFIVLTAFGHRFFTFENCSECRLEVTLVVFDSYLYAAGVDDEAQEYSSLCVFSGNFWKKIAEIPGRKLVLVSYDECIFILSKTNQEIYQIFPKCGNARVEVFTKIPEAMKVRHAVSYQRGILIFSSVTVSGEEKTAVHQLDILTKTFTTLQQLDGPAKNLVTLSDDKSTYVSQKNGDIWTIDFKDGKVTFHHLCRWCTLKDVQDKLTYDDELLVPLINSLKKKLTPLLMMYFANIEVWNHLNLPRSNFTPVLLPKNILIPVPTK
ncbi:kelch repeat and BTB domain-containing protein 3-like [Physella acuta]|uniref:kelch repeat and BTB domain-containing protein 3-like n=1 Tax=Physella acuta TaxID=109671 RepID=UPI0027DDBE4E|nr:kelch repeat and BTB domain-containing protein 3-like [Physella acuta]